jgi:hypothetical protein
MALTMETDLTLTRLARLEPGWDTYDAQPIAPAAISAARRFLDGLDHPSVVPTSDGGVQVEWHVNGVDVEVLFDAGGRQV